MLNISEEFLKVFSDHMAMGISKDLYLECLHKIEEGKLVGQPGRIEDITVKTYKDWLAIDNLPKTSQWHFHRIGGGCSMLLRYFTLHNAELLNNIIVLWIEANYKFNNFPNSDQAWSGHTVGLRLDFICCYYLACLVYDYKISYKEKIIEVMQQHAQHLMNESNYEGHWNHGLDQSIALLKTGYIFDNSKFLNCATDRILDNFRYSFNSEGVNNEQSIMYHDYNLHRYKIVFKLLKAMNIEVQEIDSLIDAASLFLLHSLNPEGIYSNIGDTVSRYPIKESRNQYINYLVTKGASGVKPDIGLKEIYKAGYIYGRTSWSYNDKPSYYTIIYGPGRLVHGHNDHMSITYHSDSKDIIIDGGFHGYKGKNDKLRIYFMNPDSHNVVFSKKYRNYKWNNTCTILNSFQDEDFDFYSFFDVPYDNVKRFRSILIDIENDFILTFDQIFNNDDSEFVQNWNINPEFDVNLEGDNLSIRMEGKHYTILGDTLSKPYIMFGSVDSGGRIIGGYTGLGHNLLRKSKSIHYEKKGRYIEWYTAFAKADLKELIRIDQNSFILRDNVYQLFNKDEFIYIYKFHKSEKNIDFKDLDFNFLSTFTTNDSNGIHIENSTEKTEYFDLRLDSLFNNGANGILVYLEVQAVRGDIPTFFYTTDSSGKRRFDTYYVHNSRYENIVFRIPIKSKSILILKLKYFEITLTSNKIFPSPTYLVDNINTTT